MKNEIKQIILNVISDLVSDFVYYDRKEDDYLPRDSIENAVLSGQITVDEMVEQFRKSLTESLESLI